MIFNYNYTDSKRALFDKRNELLIQSNYIADILLYGDSILQSFDISRFGSKDKILNSAISGDRLNYMYKRIEVDLINLQPKKVLFLGGINDIRALIEQETEKKIIINSVFKNYQKIIERLVLENITVYPCLIMNNSEEKFNTLYINDIINKINKLLISFFQEQNIKYLSFNEKLNNSYDSLSLDYSDDGLHPNERGYFEIYKVLKQKNIIY